MTTKRWAEATIEGDIIVIRIPASVLPDALEQNPRADWSGWSVTDVPGFARDVVRELNRKEEDGSTPIHLLFDRAMAEAIEQGSGHVAEPATATLLDAAGKSGLSGSLPYTRRESYRATIPPCRAFKTVRSTLLNSSAKTCLAASGACDGWR